MTLELSGLSHAQLRTWLTEVRRIASLDEATALGELDTLAFSLAAAVQHAEDGLDEELGRSMEAGKERLKQELAAARANLEHPSRVGPFDGLHLRQSCSYTEDESERREGLALAEELEVTFAGAQIDRALTEPIASTASLPKLFRMIQTAVGDLDKRGRLTPALRQRARAAQERLARFRSGKKCDEAEVAEAGGNTRKATRLRAEAGVLLAQDWARAFPGEVATQ
jgi:hypothetical protein